jgi:hypothetical protein
MRIVNNMYAGFIYTVLMVILGFSDAALAQEGAEIFRNSACNLLTQVLTQHFGSMLTILAGTFAIISSVVGSFRMAWVLVFVSVGIFIFPNFVEVFFPDITPGC